MQTYGYRTYTCPTDGCEYGTESVSNWKDHRRDCGGESA